MAKLLDTYDMQMGQSLFPPINLLASHRLIWIKTSIMPLAPFLNHMFKKTYLHLQSLII